MKHARSIPVFLLLSCSLALVLGWAGPRANAQDPPVRSAPDAAQTGPARARDRGRHMGGSGASGRGPNGRGPMAARRGQRPQIRQLRMIDRLSKMSARERERFLASLPAQRRRMVEENLKRFEELPAERRAALVERLESFDAMAPERQARFRELLRRVAEMPDPRRRILQREFQHMQRMPEEDRLNYATSRTFQEELSQPERQLVLELVETAPEP